MHSLILAGGEGSRLLASGITVPKALVEIGGKPQIVRMVDACRRVGATHVTCAVRRDLVAAVQSAIDDHSVTVVPVATPTSLHTLVAGLAALPPGPVLCTLVDSVMPAAAWDQMHREAVVALDDADAVVAVTPFVDDESPLWADVRDDSVVQGFGSRGNRPLATGGVYWLSDNARTIAQDAVDRGTQRLRGFLAELVTRGARVRAVEVATIVDVDTSDDLEMALALVHGETK